MQIEGMKMQQGYVKGIDFNQNVAQKQLKNEKFDQMMKRLKMLQ